ncbi:MAG: hypothetical protein ACO1NQ_11060 [Flavobacteriales bacterium]
MAKKKTTRSKRSDEFVAAVGRALKRSAKVARKVAKMHGTPVAVMKDGKMVLEKP